MSTYRLRVFAKRIKSAEIRLNDLADELQMYELPEDAVTLRIAAESAKRTFKSLMARADQERDRRGRKRRA